MNGGAVGPHETRTEDDNDDGCGCSCSGLIFFLLVASTFFLLGYFACGKGLL